MVSTSSSDATLITHLDVVSAQLNRYLSIAILVFGIIGNLLNCLALSQRALRSNPCASLFLASSIANLVTLISGVAVRLLAGWSADLTENIDWLCKFRVFILFTSRTIASWLITLATIDRWLSSSTNAHRREMSTLKNAQRSTILLIFVSILIYAQILYCYKANLINTPSLCYGRTAWCRILVDLEFACISIIIPSLLMFIFGLMTVLNIRQTTLRRIQPTVVAITSQTTNKNRSSQQRKKTDHDLLIMLLIQVILLTLFSLPQAIQNLYSNITLNEIRSPLANAINNFIFNLFILLTYVTNGMPFYIYTLTGGTAFRKALFDATRELIQKITCRRR